MTGEPFAGLSQSCLSVFVTSPGDWLSIAEEPAGRAGVVERHRPDDAGRAVSQRAAAGAAHVGCNPTRAYRIDKNSV